MIDGEEWRPIPSLEGYYEASSLGRIRSVDRICVCRHRHGMMVARRTKGKVLSVFAPRRGSPYRKVSVSVEGATETRNVPNMVCAAFHGERPEGMEVGHRDGKAQNDRADNLRWVTRKENVDDRFIHGTVRHGDNHPTAIFTVRERAIIRRIRGISHEKIAELLKVNREVISHIFQNKPIRSRQE